MDLKNLLFVWNIHAALETMNTSLRQTSLNNISTNAVKFVTIIKRFIDVQFVSNTSLC